MENLDSALPRGLMFEDPQRAVLSTRRTVSVKPTTGTKIENASSQDIIQFRLPNTGVLAGCYLKGRIDPLTITAGTTTTNTFGVDSALQDPYAPAASWVRRMVVKASDGTELSNVNNYHRYCSIMGRFKNDKGWSENQGSILEHTPTGEHIPIVDAAYNQDIIDQTPTADLAASSVGISLCRQYDSNFKRQITGTGARDFVHQFETGILAGNKAEEYMLPLALMGSGMNLELTCADVGEVFRLSTRVSATVGASSLDLHPAVGASLSGYKLSDLELVCDLVFYPPEIMANLAQKMCNGLKIVVDNVRQQQNPVSQQENTIILNQHARSVKSIVAGVKNSTDANNIRRDEGEYYYRPSASGSALKSVQFSVGSEQCPANAISFGAQSYHEFEKALKPVVGEDFKMGNQIGRHDYLKTYRADTAGLGAGGAGVMPGSCLFGINLQSHPEMPDVLSGKSASAGSIPISMNLEFDGGTALGSAVVETFVVSDSVIELLADGSALVSK